VFAWVHGMNAKKLRKFGRKHGILPRVHKVFDAAINALVLYFQQILPQNPKGRFVENQAILYG
jgi:hypothetical protein